MEDWASAKKNPPKRGDPESDEDTNNYGDEEGFDPTYGDFYDTGDQEKN